MTPAWAGGDVTSRATCVLAPNPGPMTLEEIEKFQQLHLFPERAGDAWLSGEEALARTPDDPDAEKVEALADEPDDDPDGALMEELDEDNDD